MNYFIAAIGRSGTTWLSRVLGCAHEDPDPRDKTFPHGYSPFPVERFWAGGADYGECSGMLRYHLSAACPGRERLIPRRAFLRRDPRAIIASWMDEPDRRADELAAVIFEVLWHYQSLTAWAEADPAARIVDLEILSTNEEALIEFAAWLGLRIEITPETLRPVNAKSAESRIFRWGEEEIAVMRAVAARLHVDTLPTLWSPAIL